VKIQSVDQVPVSRSITLRPVRPEDRDLLVVLYATTRADEMQLVPWTDEQKAVFVKMQFVAREGEYQKRYPSATHEIVEVNGTPAGQLYVARLQKEIRIIDITIMPQERNRGIGTFLLKKLLKEGQQNNLPVTIYVEESNVSLKLFERLAFKQVDQHGFHLLLRWQAGPG
jgi:ribosomal protein S18 acetylase RimI-like enzyme